MRVRIILLFVLALLLLAFREPAGREIDYTPCFIGMGENLRICHIYHESDGRLVIEFEPRMGNIWFQFDGDGLVETWFDRKDIGNGKRAAQWRFIARDGVPDPGMGISTDPGYVAVRITGRLKRPSGMEDAVPDNGS